MRFKLPNSLKICLGTCMAALILGLQNIDEYCEQFESNHRDLVEAAEWVKNAAYSTGLPDLYEAERKLFVTASRLLPINNYKIFLRPSGRIFFKTDDDELFTESLDYFAEAGFEIEFITYDMAENPLPENILSVYHPQKYSSFQPVCKL